MAKAAPIRGSDAATAAVMEAGTALDFHDLDVDDRLVFARDGRLRRRMRNEDVVLADFTQQRPDPEPAPEWARRPLV